MSSSFTTCGSTSADLPPFLIGADFAADFFVPAFAFAFFAMLSPVERRVRTRDCTRGHAQQTARNVSAGRGLPRCCSLPARELSMTLEELRHDTASRRRTCHVAGCEAVCSQVVAVIDAEFAAQRSAGTKIACAA